MLVDPIDVHPSNKSMNSTNSEHAVRGFPTVWITAAPTAAFTQLLLPEPNAQRDGFVAHYAVLHYAPV